MPKTLVVPTDFSDASRAALPHARALAEAWGAGVALVHVLVADFFTPGAGEGLRALREVQRSVGESAKARLRELAAELGPGLRVEVECREGRVFEQVDQVAAEREDSLVVVATHGRSGVSHALLGSNAERIVRSSPVPVLTVHAGEQRPPLSPDTTRRILLPTDFSPTSRTALEPACWFASAQTELFAAHAIEPAPYAYGPFGLLPGDMGEVEVELRTRAADAMRQWMAEVRARHPHARGTIVEGHSAAQIVHLAETEDVDLIAMATHGYTGLKRMYLGTVAEKVVRRARCPVLTVREAKAS